MDDEYNGCVDLDLWDDLKKNSRQKSQSISVGSTPLGGITSRSYVDSHVPAPLSMDETDTVRIKGNLVISDVDGNNKVDVTEFMKTMQERFCVLQPNFEAMEEYPALKDAYDQYKMLEKLLMENNNAKKD